MIYAETPRLILRSLEPGDLPRVAELIGDWEVSRWLAAVPHPYSLKDAEDYYIRMAEAAHKGVPEYFLLQQKKDGAQIGAVGLHPSRELISEAGERVIGYWLGKNYWGQGLMSEAVPPVIDIAFKRPDVALLTATTDLENNASQNVLRKAGLAYLGVSPRRDVQETLRGSGDVTRWQLTRGEYEKRKKAA